MIINKNEEIRRVITHYRDKERYYKKVISKRLVSYEQVEPFIPSTDSSVDGSVIEISVEEKLQKQAAISALKKALIELSDDERQIINECFFTDEQTTYTELAKNYGISRQAYCKRLKRILAKLKPLVEYYLENRILEQK